jgi:hypothetical protein
MTDSKGMQGKMNPEVEFYTETMARVYAEQGHWAKAAEIYRYLLALEPERRDLAEALAAVENNMEATPRSSSEDLVPLFREWIELLFKHQKLQKLRRLKEKL